MKTDNQELPACPACGRINNAHVSMSDKEAHAPDPGDITICAYCLSMNEFKEDHTLGTLSLTEQAKILDDSELGPVVKKARLRLHGLLPPLPI